MTLFDAPSSFVLVASKRLGCPLPTDLILERAGARSWRVSDDRIPAGEGRFLAFIDEKDDEFEVMELTEDFVWTAFATMSEALAHIRDTWGELRSVVSIKTLGMIE